MIFTDEELKTIPKVPHHIALIMDGNRRWAKERKRPLSLGHYRGAVALDRLVVAALEIGIKVVTAYSFSTENWKRSPSEVQVLMTLLDRFLLKKRGKMIKNGVRFETIGDLTALSASLQERIKETKAMTAGGKKLDLVLAINYGARDDICRAATKAAKALAGEMITEEEIAKYLDTAPWPDPELLVRSSGEMRLSNFLLWELCYSELYMTDVLWPDFSPAELLKAVRIYGERQRRWGA